MRSGLFVLAILFAAGCGGEQPQAAATPELSESSVSGGAIFASQCAMCHGEAGAGTQLVPETVDFTSPAWQTSHTDEQIAATIRQGVPGTTMPPFPAIDGAEIEALVSHVRSLDQR